MMSESNRRQVLGGGAAILTAASLGGAAFAKARPWRVGVIGCGWYGVLNLHALAQIAPVETVALCDVDRRMLEGARQQAMAFPDAMARPARRPELYRDFRAMLAKHHFDIVIVATPDHWHALPAIAAVNAGAHVYLEKPVTVDIVEGRAVLAAARANNRVVQCGTQRRNSACHIEARERVVKAGLLGKIGYVEVFGYYHQRPAQFPPPSPPPEWLDWEFYCGPAPLVPYNAAIHPRQWRAFREFCNGYVGDLGVHFIDTCRWMLDLGAPKRVASVGGVYVDKASAATTPDTQTAQFEFGDVLMSWGNREWGAIPADAGGWGAILYGDKGTLKLGSVSYEFTPLGGGAAMSGNDDAESRKFPHDQELRNDIQGMALTRPNMRDFVAAIEAGQRPASDIEEVYISTSCCILANLAMDLGRPVRWDGKAVIGDEAAEKRLARPYRAPWTHPADVA